MGITNPPPKITVKISCLKNLMFMLRILSMIAKNNIYGPKYRKLRVLHHINLVNAARNVTNKSTLAEWEKGKDNLSWCKVIQLLFNIHIQPIEFLENSVRSQLYESINNIAVAYRDNNKKQSKKILKKNLEKYQEKSQNQNKDILFQVAIASNFYEDLSGDRVCPLVVKNKVILYFSDVVSNENFWCYEDIFYFNLITQILDARHLYGFSLKLLEYVRNNRINSKIWYELVLNTLLNAEFSLIKKDLNKAESLLNDLNTLEVIDCYAQESIRKKFMESLILYLKNDSNTEVYSLFRCLDFLDLTNMKLDFETAFLQIKEIYKK